MNKVKISTGLCVCLVILFSSCTRHNTNYQQMRYYHLHSDQAKIDSRSVLPSEPLTLPQCIDIALCRNLSLLLKKWEAKVQREITLRETWSLLPDLNVDYTTKGRDTTPGSSSKSLDPNTPPSPPSVSSEKNTQRFESQLTFDIIDFGISYHLAQQEKNRTLVLCAEYERLRQNLIADVIEEYGNAVSAKIGVEGSKLLLKKAKEENGTMDSLIEARILSEISGLENKDFLLSLTLDLKEYEKVYRTSLKRLAELMGIAPSTPFTIKLPIAHSQMTTIAPASELEELALYHRPELYGKDLEEKIAVQDVRVALLRTFPSLDLFVGYNRDENKFLIKNHWLSAGITIAKNLFDIPQQIKDRHVAIQKRKRAYVDRLFVSLGVLAQLHIACIEYEEELELYRTYYERSVVKQRLLDAAKKAVLWGEFSEFQLTQYELDALVAEIERAKAHSRLIHALGKVNNAIGIPFYYDLNF